MDSALANAVEKLEAQVRRAASEIESLRGARSTLEERCSGFEGKNKELADIRAVLDKACKNLEKENQKLQASNEELRKEVEDLALAARSMQKAGVELAATSPAPKRDPTDRIAEMEGAWSDEKRELKSRVTSLVSGLQELLESTRS